MFPSLINCASHHGKKRESKCLARTENSVSAAFTNEMPGGAKQVNTHYTEYIMWHYCYNHCLFTLKKNFYCYRETQSWGSNARAKLNLRHQVLKTFTVAIIRIVKYDGFTNSVYMTENNASIYKEERSRYWRKYGSWLCYPKAPTKSAPFLFSSSELRNTANCVKSCCTGVRINIMFTLILWHNYWFGTKKKKSPEQH